MERPEAAIDRMLRLIDLEREAEVEETADLLSHLSGAQLEAKGISILRLAVTGEEGGLGGRILLTLARTTGEPLPPASVGPGDIVRIAAADPAGEGRRRPEADRVPTGVVWRKDARRVVVAVDDLPEEGIGDGALRLDRLANDVTYRRMRQALERLRAADRGRPVQLREVLLGDREPRFGALRPLDALHPALNGSQEEAVRLALSALDVALIHGPPGTGKTTAVCELIRQAVARREKVLATAPSNVAVDNLAESLAASGARVVRLGHPARLLPSVVDISLDALVEAHQGTRVAADLRRELAKSLKRMRRERDWNARRALRETVKSIRREIAGVEEAAVRDVIDGADAVLATCTGAGDPVLGDRAFDLAVIDEAAQALEPACWIPILRSNRLVLAGDHRQLPPTIISREAERGGLGTTMFDRLMGRGEGRISRLLTTQYRMHRTIMEYPSARLYGGKLEAAPSVEGHLLAGMDGVAEAPATLAPLLFIDTAGCGYDEETEAEGESKENAGEAEAAARHAESLAALGVPPAGIGVISPYAAQVRRLRDRLAGLGPGLEVDTVDGFQGREKEAIVISLVRSNRKGEVGFLSDVRRINVAVTRARRHLAVIGDSATVAADSFMKGFIEHCEAAGAYRSAWEMDLGDLAPG